MSMAAAMETGRRRRKDSAQQTRVGIQGAGSCEQRPGVFAAEKQGQPGPYAKLEKYVRITKHL